MSDRSERRLARAHRRAREAGVSRPLYAVVRAIVSVVLRGWLRLHVEGADHVPERGAAIIVANHKSFLDPFFIGLSTHRHVRYMAKSELFMAPVAGPLVRLGAFPVRRGESDGEAMSTARALLEQGAVVVAFAEGTRVDEPDALGAPHHGAGRLALETDAPIVPAALSGTSKLWFGPFLKPRRVQVAFLAPIEVGEVREHADAVSELIDGRVWPAVVEEYGRLRATPGVAAAALTAIGLGALAARRRRPTPPPRVIGTIDPRRIRRARASRSPLARLRRRRNP